MSANDGSNRGLEDPIFLLASERSGTNMTRAILGSHPKIAAPTSPHLLMNFRPDLHRYGDLTRDENFRRLAEDVATVLDHQLGEWEETIEPGEIVAEAPDRSFAGVLAYVYRREMEACGAERVFFKENEAFFHAEYLLRNFPDAKFIYLVRDGRDMVLSYHNSLSHFGTVRDGAEVWRDEQRACLRLLCDPDFAERMLPIHYEDILAFPEESVREICDFVGEEYDEAMMEFHRDRSNEKAADAVHSWDNLSNPIMRSNYGKYKNQFSDRTVRTIESIMYRELYQAGYPLERPLESYADAGDLTDTVAKGLKFVRNVLQNGEMMDLDEFSMRRERVRVFSEMQNSLESDHMEPLLNCRALETPN